MERSERLAAYLDEVCAQVRWKQAHPVIARELADHIEDERQGFIAQGFPEEAAENQAIKAMGNALEVGKRFDEAYRPQKNWSVWLPFAVLLVFGFFARAYVKESFSLDHTPALLIVFFGICFVPVDRLSKWAWIPYGVYCVLHVAMIVAPAWIYPYAPLNWYANYFLLFLPALSALLIYRMRGRGILGVCLLCLAHTVIALIALQNSIGNYVLVALACMCLLIYAVIQGWFTCNKAIAISIAVGPAVLLLAAMVVAQPHRFVQMLTLVSPEMDPQGAGFLGTTIREVLAAAKFVGPMDSALLDGAVVDYIFRSTLFANDCMLTLIAARLGKIVFVLAVLLLLIFMFFSLRLCFKQRSMLGRFLSLSVLLTFAVQAAGYIAGNMGVILLLRYPMPFVAYGNQAMLCNLILCGLLFSTFRTGALLDDRVMQRQPQWKIKLVREL